VLHYKLFYTARLGGNTILYVAPVDQKTPQASTNEIVKNNLEGKTHGNCSAHRGLRWDRS
jgi:hypothetical protein